MVGITLLTRWVGEFLLPTPRLTLSGENAFLEIEGGQLKR